MGRTRGFDEAQVLAAAGRAFVAGGYEATSVDDLVSALGVHRGSLYNTFGSKRGLFLRALRHHVGSVLDPLLDPLPDPGTTADLVSGPELDLVIVAAVELGAVDAEVAGVVRAVLERIDAARPEIPGGAAGLLGARLRARLLGASSGTTATDHHPPTGETP